MSFRFVAPDPIRRVVASSTSVVLRYLSNGDNDTSSLCITWKHPSVSRVVRMPETIFLASRCRLSLPLPYPSLYLMPPFTLCLTVAVNVLRRLNAPLAGPGQRRSELSPMVTHLDRLWSPNLRTVAHGSARASAIVSEAILKPPRPRPPSSSLALFAFWLRSSVVSVLFSLISETFLREHSRLFLFLNPAFWSLGLLIP
jgi:hypothetical protein